MQNPLLKAISICGSQSALGERIGKGQYIVTAWVRRYGCKVSAEFVVSVSQATGWLVTPHELRPDIYPHPHDGLPDYLRRVESSKAEFDNSQLNISGSTVLPAHGPECGASQASLST